MNVDKYGPGTGGTDGNPNIAGYPTEGLSQGHAEGTVTDPNTGLPMNVGKFGSGAGGTNGSTHIHGYQNQ